jgi:hypothetical protein
MQHHHIAALEKKNMLIKTGEKYGMLFFISNYFEANIEAFHELWSAIEKDGNLGRSGKK